MQPSVVGIMLDRGDRKEMAARARRCFDKQGYPNKRLLTFDTSGIVATIGELRNMAIAGCTEDIVVTWDNDDWSHPNRIAEQVALLQSSGKECVGYREMLFWRSPRRLSGDFLANEIHYGADAAHKRLAPSQVWLYINCDPRYCLGTSLCYWRSVWERRPFPDLPKAKGGTGEDTQWLREVDSAGISAQEPGHEMRMIATIHGANSQYYGEDLLRNSPNWRRVPEWDERVRAIIGAAFAAGPVYWQLTSKGKWTPVNEDNTPHWSTCPNAKDFKKKP